MQREIYSVYHKKGQPSKSKPATSHPHRIHIAFQMNSTEHAPSPGPQRPDPPPPHDTPCS